MKNHRNLKKIILFNPVTRTIMIPFETHGKYDSVPCSQTQSIVERNTLSGYQINKRLTSPQPLDFTQIPPGISLVTYTKRGSTLSYDYAFEVYNFFLNFFEISTEQKINTLKSHRDFIDSENISLATHVDITKEYRFVENLMFSSLDPSVDFDKSWIPYYKFLYQRFHRHIEDIKREQNLIKKLRFADSNPQSLDYVKYFGFFLEDFFDVSVMVDTKHIYSFKQSKRVSIAKLFSRIYQIFRHNIQSGWTVELHLIACRVASTDLRSKSKHPSQAENCGQIHRNKMTEYENRLRNETPVPGTVNYKTAFYRTPINAYSFQLPDPIDPAVIKTAL